MPDPVLVAKAAIVERCVARAREELEASADFRTDFTRQDAATLNVQRACEAVLDMAFRLVRTRRLGAPTVSSEAFDLMTSAGLLPSELAGRLKRMVGFRNIVVHQYRTLSLEVLETVIRSGLDDLLAFSAAALRLQAPKPPAPQASS